MRPGPRCGAPEFSKVRKVILAFSSQLRFLPAGGKYSLVVRLIPKLPLSIPTLGLHLGNEFRENKSQQLGWPILEGRRACLVTLLETVGVCVCVCKWDLEERPSRSTFTPREARVSRRGEGVRDSFLSWIHEKDPGEKNVYIWCEITLWVKFIELGVRRLFPVDNLNRRKKTAAELTSGEMCNQS